MFDQSDPDLPWPELPAGRRLVLVRNQRTPGLAGARNSGILAATGELVAFCDDDDEWLPEKLTRQVARLLATPSAAVSTTGILVRYQDRTTTRLAPTELGHPPPAAALAADRAAPLDGAGPAPPAA